MEESTDAYRELLDIYDEISVIGDISSILNWDQYTYMPTKAVEGRGGQFAYLSKLAHRKITDPKVGALLSRLEGADLEEKEAAVVREIYRTYRKKTSGPEELESKIARLEPISAHAWIEAKKKGDFSIFAPRLEEMISLKMEVAEKVGYPEIPYDALLEDHEPYTYTEQVRIVFTNLRAKLVPIIEKLVSVEADEINFPGEYPVNVQDELYRRFITDMGYDLERGRLDTTEHPFTIGTGDDTRITTHYYDHDPRPALFSCIHEGGHALYEQGFLREYMHTPLGEACSLGIHESQSRFWENLIGRSMPFWKHYYPVLQAAFPRFSSIPLAVFYKGVNQVRPSLIRVEADEATYNLHILIRFELELDIFGGRLEVSEIPVAWNDKYESYLGIRPDSDTTGCLQDIHWSIGSFGYFPTYALGNLYAAQFFASMRSELDVDDLLGKGELAPVLAWLRKNIHERGKLYPASELVKIVTGSELSEDHFIEYLKNKFGPIYGVML